MFAALTEHVNTITCDGGCCTETGVVEVVCGLDPTQPNGCCFTMLLTSWTVCKGRPFIVDGAARIAELASRADWQAELAPDLLSLDEAARQELAS